ncbi:MAG: menaquinone biosynthesis protein [Desulfobulbaceae bacterium]|nr:menaquinone biosynthesis protein [Desulfobulbaceae bacterium]
MTENARIGMVNYLNTAPIHEKWKETVHCDKWQLVEAPPAALNRKLFDGDIDLGFVSCFEYGAHSEKYKLLSGLSISANGPVGSVFLFSHVPMEQLHDAPVLLTSQSETSVHLVKIILEEFNKVVPVYSSGNIMDVENGEFKAVLAIGDDALRLVEKSTYLYQFDLGDIWKRETGLPFVFGVCAVREEFCDSHPETLENIHRELIRCRDEGKADLDAVCEISAARIPLSKQKCHDYLKGIEYDLAGQKRKAIESFFEILIKRGEIDGAALPLKLFVNLSE